MRTRLKLMDVVTHEGKLWVVTQACNFTKVPDSEQLVNLSLYAGTIRKEDVPASECRIVKDVEERRCIGDRDVFGFFPDTDFLEGDRP